MTFVDANVPMYLVGGPHPNKVRALATLNRLAVEKEILVTDVEVFQEILHRYTHTRRFNIIDRAIASLDSIADYVLTYGMPEIYIARDLIRSVGGLAARDALHVAVMQRDGISRILSYDARIDSAPGIQRLE